jgi:autotransporter-associated beta strand protein
MKIPSLLSATILATCSLLGTSHAVPTIAGGNGSFETNTFTNPGFVGINGLWETTAGTVTDWTFTGTGRWFMQTDNGGNNFGAPQDGEYYVNLSIGATSFALSMSTAITGLTIGTSYAVEFYASERVGITAGTSFSASVDTALPTNLTVTEASLPPVTTGFSNYVKQTLSFTATSETHTFTISNSGTGAGGNGFMVDNFTIVEEPWVAADGIWTGGDGNWNTPANWQGNTIGQGIDKSAIFNGLTPVTATVDVVRPIGALLFSGSNHTIAAGTGSLSLDGDTVYPTPTVTVANGFTATISAKLASADELTKAGTGTLTLSAQNNFSNAINVSQGTLELATDWTFGNVGTGTPIVPGLVTVESGATLRSVNSLANQLNGLTLNGGTVEAVGVGNADWGNFHLTGNVTATGTSNLNAEVALRASNVDFFTDTGATLNAGGVMHNGAYFGIYSGAPANVSKSGDGTMVLSAANTYTGNTGIDAGTLVVSSTGSLRFSPTTNGITNSVTTSGSGTLSYLGTVNLDLSAANTTLGNSWPLFSLTSYSGLTPAFVTSTLGSFTEGPSGTWELPVTGAKWVFTESNGNLAYAVTATDYDTWKSANGVTGGENDDDDNDGLTNHEEYAFGLDPTGGSSVNPIAVPFDKATGTFSYTRRDLALQDPDLTYTVWYSTDLAAWTQDTGATDGTPVVNGEVETVPITLTGSLITQPKLFIQVRAD